MSDYSNEELLTMYQNLEYYGFEEFFNRNKLVVFSFLKSKLTDPRDAEEALQETFFRIHRFILQYDSSKPALAWVFSIASNTAYDQMAKNSKQQSFKDLSREDLEPENTEAEKKLLAKEELNSLLEPLDVVDRKKILDRFLENKSTSEIASLLNIKESNAREKISRLLQRLRKTA